MIDFAQATKEGNFSLKIIAFMTMLSMPGTLFTAPLCFALYWSGYASNVSMLRFHIIRNYCRISTMGCLDPLDETV